MTRRRDTKLSDAPLVPDPFGHNDDDDGAGRERIMYVAALLKSFSQRHVFLVSFVSAVIGRDGSASFPPPFHRSSSTDRRQREAKRRNAFNVRK